VCLLGSDLASPQGAALEEYQVKAAFLFNFAKFVQWPPGSLQSPSDPVNICVFGKDPFDRALENTVANHSIDGHPVIVRPISGAKQVLGCHILFIGAAETSRAAALLKEIGIAGILSVGDSNAPSHNGAVINFRNEGGKVRFEIDVQAAERQNLHISSRLLSLAQHTAASR
jgi:hypothetical protein